jgi:hypothetical protein
VSAAEVPTRDLRHRLEDLYDELLDLRALVTGRAARRSLDRIAGELQACVIEYYGQTKPPPTSSKDPAWNAKNRPDGTRRCAGCRAWKPVAEFDYKDRKRGILRSHCRPCWKAYQRERYVAANRRAIIVDLLEGDDCVGTVCLVCGQVLAIGDRVLADGIRHEKCAE